MKDYLPAAVSWLRRLHTRNIRTAMGAVPTHAALVAIITLTFCGPANCCAQGLPTAARLGDLQIGGGYVLGDTGYNSEKVRGGAVYSTFDFSKHYGVEAEFHQAQSTSDSTLYERTYEVGGRYHLTFGHFVPYGKLMIGRGVFNYPQGIANLAYNIFAAGIGADYRVAPSVNLRADYEFQDWLSFPQGNLKPNLVTIGVAYHFHE